MLWCLLFSPESGPPWMGDIVTIFIHTEPLFVLIMFGLKASDHSIMYKITKGSNEFSSSALFQALFHMDCATGEVPSDAIVFTSQSLIPS